MTVGGCPGLVLMVMPSGSKVFRLQFTFDGKSQLLTIGQYPSTSLSEARAAALAHKENIRKGINPCAEKRSARTKARADSMTFRDVTAQWLEKSAPGWSEVHKKDTRQKLNAYILPRIGDKGHTHAHTEAGQARHGQRGRVRHQTGHALGKFVNRMPPSTASGPMAQGVETEVLDPGGLAQIAHYVPESKEASIFRAGNGYFLDCLFP